jgi:hypothetical protein
MDGLDVEALVGGIDDYVAELLDSLALTAPPFEPRTAARRLGFEVLTDASQGGRGRHVRLAGRTVLVVKPEDRPERSAWTLAHELGEALMADLVRRTGASAAVEEGRSRETVANLFATRFLLPSRPFRAAWDEFNGELPDLKQRFTNASHELVATRWLDFSPTGIVTVFDQGRMTRRVGANGRRTGGLAERERECRAAVCAARAPARCEGEGWIVRGWAVDEPGWQREILMTEVPPEDSGDFLD